MRKIILILLAITLLTTNGIAEYSWEETWEQRIENMPDDELDFVKYVALIASLTDEQIQFILDTSMQEIVERIEEKADGESEKAEPQYVTIGKAQVAIGKARLFSEGSKAYVQLNYTWYHTEPDAQTFLQLVSASAYQDGIGLGVGFVFSVDTETTTSVIPNTVFESSSVFELRSLESDVLVILKPFMDFSNNPGIEVTIPVRGAF